MRVFYAAGPGDVVQTYRHWRDGRSDSSEVAVTYCEQFFAACAEGDHQALVVSSCARRDRIVDGKITVENRPHRRIGRGVVYHADQLARALRLAWRCRRFGADLAIVSDVDHAFVFGLPMLRPAAVVPSMHCTLWPHGSPPTRKWWRTPGPMRWLLRDRSFAIFSIGERINQQIDALTGECHAPIVNFLPLYRPDAVTAAAPPVGVRPFRVLYAGRVERNKGVFDLLKIARRLYADGRNDVVFDICGDGAMVQPLRDQAFRSHLSEVFRVYGKLDRADLGTMLTRAHAVIAPTTADFNEGMNKSIIEGVLAGRPVIASTVCGATQHVGPAMMAVEPGDINGYIRAILQLADSPRLYHRYCEAGRPLRRQFFDQQRSFQAALSRVFCAVERREPPKPISWFAGPSSTATMT